MSAEIVVSSFKTWFRVRGGFSGPAVFLVIMFFVEGAFWRAVSGHSGAVGGYTGSRILLYLFSALVISQICACVGEPDALSRRVESGGLDAFLLRPAGYVGQMLSVQLGLTLARAATLWPLLPLSELMLTGDIHWRAQAAALALLPAASAINFLINLALGTLSFYFRDSYAFVIFKETLCWVLNGTLIPLDLLPAKAAAAAMALPPAFVVYHPAKVALGETPFLAVLSCQALFLALLWLAACGAWELGVRSYQAYGG